MNCFAYVRVSTTKQRDQGVSLEAQEEAIKRYAQANGLTIKRWFRETRTAASRGRTKFNDLLRRLKRGEAQGVIVHKIDRSARNLRDWADFAELSDLGIAIHIAAENLDLTSRGGRLSADIQAVVAADYIRNLRLEAIKGIRGRYKQGLLPGYSPVGYRDNGGGKVKTVDPVSGPLVQELFRRYATGAYGLRSLRTVMHERGLRNKRGGELSLNSVSKILNQRFYIGQIEVKRTGEIFQGKHEPLVTKALFDACQDILRGRTQRPTRSFHPYVYRKLLTCQRCGRRLIAERQKSHVYYRCHTKNCPQKCLREEVVERNVLAALERIRIAKSEQREIESEVDRLLGSVAEEEHERRLSLELERDQVTARLTRLTDLLLDGVIEQTDYVEKKRSLLDRQLELHETIKRPRAEATEIERRVANYLELASSASLSYRRAEPTQKRQLVETTTSNLTVVGNEVVVELDSPFAELAQREGVLSCGPQRDRPRSDPDLPIRQDVPSCGPQRDKPGTPGTCRTDQLQPAKLAQNLIQAATEDRQADTWDGLYPTLGRPSGSVSNDDDGGHGRFP